MAVVLLLVVVHTSLANPSLNFIGVLDPYGNGVVIDSVTVVPPDTTFLTTGWSAEGLEYDTFDFPDLAQWPTDLWVYGTTNGQPRDSHIVGLAHDQWYPFGVGTVVPWVKFNTYHAIEEPGLTVEPRQFVTVSPSVVTGQMTVRLQAVGTSRPVVEIHDARGTVVRSLDCPTGADGIATATWTRKDDRGHLVPGGVYFVRQAQAQAQAQAVRKVLVAH